VGGNEECWCLALGLPLYRERLGWCRWLRGFQGKWGDVWWGWAMAGVGSAVTAVESLSAFA